MDAYENETPEIGIQKAFEQIRQKKYAAELIALGVQDISSGPLFSRASKFGCKKCQKRNGP